MEGFSSPDCFEAYMDMNIQRCPFLRSIKETTVFSFSPAGFNTIGRGVKGPIFEDGPSFDMAFRLFHGHDGVIPLTDRSFSSSEASQPDCVPHFNPLAAKAATISLSVFGHGGPLSLDAFNEKRKKENRTSKRVLSSPGKDFLASEVSCNKWLETGNCPIAKSYRSVSKVLPHVAKVLHPPPGMKFRCPPAIVAARAALARTTLTRTLRPQPLPAKILAVVMLGMATNIPLGVWKEHTKKFSPAWFIAVHAAVPFIAMLRKSVLIPKAAMTFTIAASVLGQVIGSRAERYRLKMITEGAAVEMDTLAREGQYKIAPGQFIGMDSSGRCSVARAWKSLPDLGPGETAFSAVGACS